MNSLVKTLEDSKGYLAYEVDKGGVITRLLDRVPSYLVHLMEPGVKVGVDAKDQDTQAPGEYSQGQVRV